MIIWFNGGFGAGKSTLTEELHRRLPDAVVYDPEDVRLMLWKWMRPNGDFQHLPSWLSEHGADYGLCHIYSNGPWHYDLSGQAVPEEGGEAATASRRPVRVHPPRGSGQSSR